MIEDVEGFIKNLRRDSDGHVVLNMFDNSILHDSYLESSLRCSAPAFERKPDVVRFVQSNSPWDGITIFTDKVLHLAPKVESSIKVAWLVEPRDLLPQIYQVILHFEDHYDFIFN